MSSILVYYVYFFLSIFLGLLVGYGIAKTLKDHERDALELERRTEGAYSSAMRVLENNTESTISQNNIEKVHFEYVSEDNLSLICPNCNYENSMAVKICKLCKEEIPNCQICKKPVGSENIAYCPYCSAVYHKIEFLEWLKVKAYCVCCKKGLDLWEFQKYQRESEHTHEKFLLICSNCKAKIPKNAKFCIHCGIALI